MINRRRLYLSTIVACCILLIAGCSGSNTDSENNESVLAAVSATPIATLEPTMEPTPEPTPTPMPYYAPLTGVGLEEEATDRPIAVMINNYSAARPQSGLTQADVVWEVLAEGGITRLEAIFQSTKEITNTLGPIRSNRAYLIDIADSYGAIMAHAGGSPEAYGILQKQGKAYLDEISNAGSYFWRSSDRKAPHNLYSEIEKLREAADKRGYTKQENEVSYIFSTEGSIMADYSSQAVHAPDVAIKFLNDNYEVGYRYDEVSKQYYRSINDEPHIDLNNNEQLTAVNLVVFETTHKVLDNVGRLSIDLKTGGAGYLFQQGKRIDVQWVRRPDGMIRFIKDGEEIAFLPGTTYIHIVPNSPALAEHIS